MNRTELETMGRKQIESDARAVADAFGIAYDDALVQYVRAGLANVTRSHGPERFQHRDSDDVDVTIARDIAAAAHVAALRALARELQIS